MSFTANFCVRFCYCWWWSSHWYCFYDI